MRGLVACLSSVTEVPLAEIPQLEDVPATHALASSKSWLAGRGFGIVPIAEARSFQWAGWWIAIVDTQRHSSGRRFATAARRSRLRTPPGVVLSPQDPGLLERAAADLDIRRYNLTLIAAEVVEELTTRDALVGRDFRIGDVHCRGLRLAEPCAHLERLHGPGLLRPLIHRGGLRVDILSDGYIAEGSSISTDLTSPPDGRRNS